MKIVTWNVNSIRARVDNVVAWLEEAQPDIVLLQETKVEDFQFPYEAIGNAGYDAAHYGQKSYNGVAILSRGRAQNVVRGFADGAPEDEPRRIISADLTVNGEHICVCSVYVPNGQAVNSEKYHYKLEWLARFERLLARGRDVPFIVGGDFNIAPADVDVYDPPGWEGQTLCSPKERAAFTGLLGTGLHDAYRTLVPDAPMFTWWDYRAGGYEKNLGLRIDHFLLNDAAMKRCTSVVADRAARGLENPSDHAPVTATFT